MTFDPVLPVWLIAVLLLALLIYSMIIEWRRPLRFPALRLISCVIAVASLAFIILRPSMKNTSSGEAVLLTNGFSVRIADSLRKALPQATFYHFGETGIKNSIRLSSYSELTPSGSISPPGTITAIVGDGLPPYALDSIHGGFQYFPSEAVDGITSLEMTREKLTAHVAATISGKYQTSETGTVLFFSGPDGKVDSLRLSPPAGNFSFSFTPRTPGRVTYSLSIKDSMQILTNDVVPLFIKPVVPLNILLMQDFPTFDIQHLKSFLSDRGHKIAMRAQLSRNIVRTEFANRLPISLNRLTIPLLDQFDVLIADPSTLLKLSPPEREALETSLHKGLGLLAVYNGEPSKALPEELLPITFAGVSSDTASVLLHGKRYTLPATRLRPASMQSVEAIVLSQDASRTLSGYTPARKGIVGFQLLRETYSILMAGDSMAYGQLWSPLLEAIARPRESPGSIRMSNAFPAYVNEPLAFDLIAGTPGGTPPTLVADSTRIPVAEDVLISDLWHAQFWEERKGWHEVRTEEDTLSYYLFNYDEWRALRVSEQQQATFRASLSPRVPGSRSIETRPVSLTAFFIAFLLAVGFLWLAPKL